MYTSQGARAKSQGQGVGATKQVLKQEPKLQVDDEDSDFEEAMFEQTMKFIDKLNK